jgi:methyl-accepting chemotaxis protein
MNPRRWPIHRQVMGAIILSSLLVIGLTLTFMFYIKEKNTRLTGLTAARAIGNQIATLRTFYTNEVVTRAVQAGMRISHDFPTQDDTLPLPVTLVKVLGDELRQNYPGSHIRLYSRFPFPHRRATETYDAFELQALAILERDPDTPFYKLEAINGRLSMRYAIADLMRPSCVSCHNTHPASPKKDWKTGDLRGVVEIIIPVDEADKVLQSGTVDASVLISGGLVLVMCIGYIVSRCATRPINEAVQTISTASTEVATTVEQHERMVTQQAASVHETTTTMEVLDVSSRQSAAQADVAAVGARQALALAEEGTKTVQHTLDGMARLKDKVEAIAEQILHLSEQTSQIGDITHLVSAVAEQTNVLALNASVEAARAGDYGKGLAVVAAEIRTLTDQSRKSAERIRTLVADIQDATNTTVMVTEEGTKTVAEGSQLAQATAEAFKRLALSIGSASEGIQHISLHVRQQAAAIGQVAEAMDALNVSARETAAGLTQTKISVQKLDEVALSLKAMV